MNIATLNGRPVMVGTKLEFLEEDRKSMWGDDYLVVTHLTEGGFVEYEGNGGEVEGTIRERELATTFKHFDELNVNPKEYPIARIADFLSIPDDKLDACLDELKLAIRSSRAISAATIAEYEELGNIRFTDQDKKVLWRVQLPVIVWQDNGENKTDVKMGGDPVMSVEVKTSDPMDVSVGDNEYYVVGADGKTITSLNAYSQEHATKKAVHHCGEGAYAVWRKYVGE